MSHHVDAAGARTQRGRRLFVGSLAVAVIGVVAAIVLLVVWPGGGSGPASSSAQAGSSAASAAKLDNSSTVSGYLSATSADVQTVTTFDYRRLADALNAGLAVTTGAYRTAFRAALTGTGAQNRISGHVVQSFEPLRSGLGAVTDGGKRAKVLVFGVQHNASTSGTTTALTTLTATVRRQGNRYLISALDEDANAGVPPGSNGLRAAAEAARSEVTNALSFRRASFDADERRALTGATGELRAQLGLHASATRASMVKGGYDLSGAVTALAVETVTPSRVTMLVAASGLRVGAGNSQTLVLDARYEVVVVRNGSAWLVTSIGPVVE
jgi:hypothetical protein